MKLERALRTLIMISRALKPNQGRIARRNARRRIIGGLRAARNALDTEFPKLPPHGGIMIKIRSRDYRANGRRRYGKPRIEIRDYTQEACLRITLTDPLAALNRIHAWLSPRVPDPDAWLAEHAPGLIRLASRQAIAGK